MCEYKRKPADILTNQCKGNSADTSQASHVAFAVLQLTLSFTARALVKYTGHKCDIRDTRNGGKWAAQMRKNDKERLR